MKNVAKEFFDNAVRECAANLALKDGNGVMSDAEWEDYMRLAKQQVQKDLAECGIV